MYTKTKLNLIFNRHCSWTRHCEIDVFGNWPSFFLNWPNFLDVLAGNFLWDLATLSSVRGACWCNTDSIVGERFYEAILASPHLWQSPDCIPIVGSARSLVPSDKRSNYTKVWCTFIYIDLQASKLKFPIKIGHDNCIISFRLLFIFKIKQWRSLQ